MPASSPVVVCNMALARVGVNSPIASLLDLNTRAQACNTFYDQLRQNMFSNYNWPFTFRRAQLASFTAVAWSSGTTYAIGALSQYGSNVYRSLVAANLGNQPNVSGGLWFQVTRDGWTYTAPMPPDMITPLQIWPPPAQSPSSGLSNVYAGSGYNQGAFYPGGLTPSPGAFAGNRALRAGQRIPYMIEDANDGTGTQVRPSLDVEKRTSRRTMPGA